MPMLNQSAFGIEMNQKRILIFNRYKTLFRLFCQKQNTVLVAVLTGS